MVADFILPPSIDGDRARIDLADCGRTSAPDRFQLGSRHASLTVRRSLSMPMGFRYSTCFVTGNTTIERRRSIRGITFHKNVVELLAFGNISGLFGRLSLGRQIVGIVLVLVDRRHKLPASIGTPSRLFDFEAVQVPVRCWRPIRKMQMTGKPPVNCPVSYPVRKSRVPYKNTGAYARA
jgi:hypothetical protein